MSSKVNDVVELDYLGRRYGVISITKKITIEKIQQIKNDFYSKINKKTKEVLSDSFDLQSHKKRGMATDLHTTENWTGDIYKSMILKDINSDVSEINGQLLKSKWVNGNKKPTLIDVGCGSGIFVKQMLDSKEFQMVYGLDPFTKTKADSIIKRNFIESWSHDIPLEDNSVDIVTTCEVLEHVPEPYISKTFKELKRVCNWRVYGQVSTRLGGEKYKDGVHAHICFAPAEWWMNEMLKAGFKIVSASENTQGLSFILEVEL